MMTEEHITTPNICLPTGSNAPLFDTLDIDGKDVSLAILLENHRGVLIDFFRGGWCQNTFLSSDFQKLPETLLNRTSFSYTKKYGGIRKKKRCVNCDCKGF